MDMTSGGLERWLRLEARSLNEGTVSRRKSLEQLLREKKPRRATRDGGSHHFDEHELRKAASVLSKDEPSKLILPISVYVDHGVPSECYIDDELAARVIRALEGFKRAYQYRDGKMWLPLSPTAELFMKYRTLKQMVHLV